jgi:cytoskeletal protein CcmA (bactofilin family)
MSSPTRASTTRVLIAVLVVVSVLAAGSASAQSVGGTVTVPAGTTHEGDLSVVSGTVIIDGTVDGSLEGVAGSIVITGTVTGNVEAAAGSLTIAGTVEGNVESGTGSIVLREDGRIGGSVETGAGSLTIDGAVDGDVRAGVETLTIGETARIGGDLTYAAERVSISGDADINGTVERRDSLEIGIGPPFDFGFGLGGLLASGTFALFGFLVNFLLGAVLLVAAPGFARRVADTGRTEVPKSGIAGLLAFFGIPVGLVALAITIVGLPLSLAGIFVYLLLLWVSFVYGGLVTGTWLLSLADYDSRWAGLALGLAIPALLAFVSLGGILGFLYILLGLGAFVLSALAVRRGGDERPPAGHDRDEPTEGPQPT